MLVESYSVLNRRREALLKKIAKVGPFMMATATYLKVRCGNPKCKCAKDKEARHEKLHLSWTDSEGSGTQYVPVAIREEVLEWIENYWTIKGYMKEMTGLNRRMIKIYSKSKPKSCVGRKKLSRGKIEKGKR